MTQRIKSKADLAALKRKIQFGSPEIAARAAVVVASQLSDLATRSFDAAQSVYGNPFGAGITLKRTGRMRAAALRYTAHGRRIVCSVAAVPHARFHIRRGILPRNAKSLPVTWQDVIRTIGAAEARAFFGAR